MKMAPKYDVSAAIQPNLYDVSLAIPLGINSAFNTLACNISRLKEALMHPRKNSKRHLRKQLCRFWMRLVFGPGLDYPKENSTELNRHLGGLSSRFS